ncbi:MULTISPECIES: hypothetical protein [Streptomyces]|uniref:DNA primase/polymerase bifunctional N-terminal domain-containing protein n=3 Tax=Streptomyces rimosus TaxID=1927 RepID=L8EIV7_STRR1|nr:MULTISPECIES: hypothetical protein [Streptomyces]MYT46914.1 hypothetical protein [Streptomyces sp. SID5471]KEF03929.1 hypothetical protein DF17_26010 [Streptomyces rimosus]KEF17477.1 hypothetical protein DF18_29245 [Streptomyces rimosus]KUJ27257.1 hypothetical protein ADK46_35540 [Streptomyces rimosus subsp. rimosus]QDA06706.1 hypothetical protein CTZ40_26050 [Streptomyces rimosus]
MSDWPSEHPRRPASATFHTASYVTLAGADWLASADPCPESVHARWAACPDAPSTLPCGSVFDVINAPALFGRELVDRLWTAGPGSGPVATHRGRILLFAEPGTARRLPALLGWEEWSGSVPPLLCHGTGDAVTVPPLFPHRPARPDPPYGTPTAPTGDAPTPEPDRPEPDRPEPDRPDATSRWLVAPDVRHPWLPGPGTLLWACIRAARRVHTGGAEPAADAPGSSAPAL